MDVFFLFPGRVWIDFYLSLGSEQTKNPTGQRSFVYFGTCVVILDFSFECQYFFNCFSGMSLECPLAMTDELLRTPEGVRRFWARVLCCLR